MHMCMWPRTPSTTSGSPRAERIAHTQSNASHARLALRRTLHLHPSLCNTSSPVPAGQPPHSALGSAHPSQQGLPLRPAQLRGFAPTAGRSWEPCSSPCSPSLPAPRLLGSSSLLSPDVRRLHAQTGSSSRQVAWIRHCRGRPPAAHQTAHAVPRALQHILQSSQGACDRCSSLTFLPPRPLSSHPCLQQLSSHSLSLSFFCLMLPSGLSSILSSFDSHHSS